MNKKGFTLVEVLAVLVILSLLLILTIPSIRDALTNGKNKINEINEKQIEDAAKIIVDEVIYCNMSDETKNILGTSNCAEVRKNLTSEKGVDIEINSLKFENDRKCTFINKKYDTDGNELYPKINIKLDKTTYKETITIDDDIECK